MAVRSKALISSTLTTTIATKYTAAVGETVLVKWIALWNDDAANTAIVTLSLGASGAARTFYRETLQPLQAVEFELWAVLQPEWVFRGISTRNGTHITVAGAELEGVAD
jgi:hypothetical protein